MPRISKVYQITEKEFKEIVASSYSYAECARKIGLSDAGSNASSRIKMRIAELGLNIDHFCQTKNATEALKKYDLDEILIPNSPYKNISRLKIRLINEGRLKYICEKCGNTGEWMGQELTLQLEHKDGDHSNHTLSNLCFLCPNCHSQTETFSGRNKK